MKIITLMDNLSVSSDLESRHGLSFYIETHNHKILFDMGPDGAFAENARKLGVDLAQVDIAFLSHGHYDHSGGFETFLQENQKASVHIQKKALDSIWAKTPEEKRYIGLNDAWRNSSRVVSHEGDYRIDGELQMFAGVTERECYSPLNDRLFVEANGRYIPDLFVHEQNLLIREGNKMVLFAGCAHSGMVNILEKAQKLTKNSVCAVFGGMHLHKAFAEEAHQRNFCKNMAKRLKQYSCSYYTGHCTGVGTYQMFREEMGEQIQYAAAGAVITI